MTIRQSMKRGRPRGVWTLACIIVVLGTLATGAASASATGPVWHPVALTDTTIAPGGSAGVLIEAINTGDANLDAANGEMDLTVTLPPGLSATAMTLLSTGGVPAGVGWTCFGNVFPSTVVRCRKASATIVPHASVDFAMEMTASSGLLPGTTLTIATTVQGGGGSAQSTVTPIRISSDLPGFGVAAIDGQIADPSGAPFTQAGGRPDSASVSFDLNTVRSTVPAVNDVSPVETVRNIFVDLPPGLVGDPQAVGQCTLSQLANAVDIEAHPLCPPESQIGTAVVRLNGTALLGFELGPYPVFNITPPADAPARFGMNVLGSLVLLDAKVRTGTDYGITISVPNTPEAIPLSGTTVSLWGNPSDPEHTADRACSGGIRPSNGGPICTVAPATVAFLRNPTSCQAESGSGVSDGLVTAIHADSWEHSGRLRPDGLPDLSDPAWKSNSFVSHDLPGYPLPPDQWGAHVLPTGCDAVPFEPQLSGQPAADAKPASPSGFSFDLTMPQPDAPGSIGEADLKQAVVTLPAGVSVSPSSANGLAACSSAQIDLSEGTVPTCPDASKIGTVSVETPLLPRPIDGTVYLAAQGDNPFGALLAIYIVAEGPGVVLKLPGHVEADPITGQLTTTFDNNPQLPFTRLHLEFAGGDHAPLVLPRQCGPYTTNATLTSWSSDQPVQSSSVFTVNGDASDCSSGTTFAPSMAAGTANPVAGADSTFDLQLARSDRDQQLGGITLNMPAGLTGRIANADLCPDAQAAMGACPAGSQVGSVTTGAGVGNDPFYITGGRAYLTGPYKGAPFGLSIVVPAKAGPFDLGNVVVRSALLVDRHTADVTVKSDPFPTILQGIPLDVRDVRVSVDKPHFFVNPTSCAPKTIYGTISSVDGWIAHASSRFQVGQCSSLGLHPRMVLSVGAKNHTAAGDATPLSTTLTMPRGNANLRWVRVSLPSTLNAHLDVINHACTRAQFDAGNCSQAKAGSATAVTPLLRDPLRGNVYFVKNGHPIPDLFVALRGQVAFDLTGLVSIPGGTRLATTFNTVPDVPITKFILRLSAGSTGTLGAAVNLCTTRARDATASLSYKGQNGRIAQVNQRIVINGCPKPKRGKGASARSGR